MKAYFCCGSPALACCIRRVIAPTRKFTIALLNTTILVEEKSSHARKKKSEQQQASISILQKYGIDNPEYVLNELLSARQGEEISIPKVKVKPIKT